MGTTSPSEFRNTIYPRVGTETLTRGPTGKFGNFILLIAQCEFLVVTVMRHDPVSVGYRVRSGESIERSDEGLGRVSTVCSN